MKKIRVLVIEDSATVRHFLVDILQECPDMEVVAEAADGKQGIELCERLRPDIVTLDMMLPSLSGMAATEYIMAFCPTPILIVSGSINRGEVFNTMRRSPPARSTCSKSRWATRSTAAGYAGFIETVKLVSRVKVITHPRAGFAR